MQGTQWRQYVGSIVLALALLGCSGDEEPTLTGAWTGTIEDNIAGTGAILLTISQSGAQLNGTWQFTFANPIDNNGGTLSGTGGNPAIALVLSTSQLQACSFTVAANLDEDNDDHFTGTYAAFNCTRAQSGGLDVTRH
jgi:hypothetical protein